MTHNLELSQFLNSKQCIEAMILEEIIYLTIFGVMSIVTMASFFSRKRALLRKSMVCIPIACIVFVFLCITQFFFEYPASPIEWKDLIDSCFRGFLLIMFIGMFVSALLTWSMPSEKQ